MQQKHECKAQNLLVTVWLCTGIGWTEETVNSPESQVVDALHPSGTGIIEYEVRQPTPEAALSVAGTDRVLHHSFVAARLPGVGLQELWASQH